MTFSHSWFHQSEPQAPSPPQTGSSPFSLNSHIPEVPGWETSCWELLGKVIFFIWIKAEKSWSGKNGSLLSFGETMVSVDVRVGLRRSQNRTPLAAGVCDGVQSGVTFLCSTQTHSSAAFRGVSPGRFWLSHKQTGRFLTQPQSLETQFEKFES